VKERQQAIPRAHSAHERIGASPPLKRVSALSDKAIGLKTVPGTISGARSEAESSGNFAGNGGRIAMQHSRAPYLQPLVVLGLALASGPLMATTLYKLVGPDGKVTYTQSVPADFQGRVSRLDIDPDANRSASPPAPKAGSGDVSRETEAEKIIRRRPPDNGPVVAAARAKAAAARRTFEDARDNSTPDDWIYVGPNNPLGMRRFPKPEYEARLASLEQAAKQAEEEASEVERNNR
jgi:hypothetical protein